ncbi:MAG: amidohydrolase family protein [Acidobacteria bacterium]|nr:amidohydrolase family protein [Acidobacteriota bacterium]
MTRYEADWICPVSSPPIRNGFLEVSDNTISGLGPLPPSREGERVAVVPGEGSNTRRFPGCAIIPGFVNVHTHIELTILRGFLEDLPFLDWVRRLTHTKYQLLSRDEMLLSARLGAAEMVTAGVTCLGEVMDLGVAWEAMKEFGLQGIAFQEVFGPDEEKAEEQLEDLKRKINQFREHETETQRIGVSPHAPYTVSAKLFQSVRDYATREKLPLTTHVAESNEEGLFTRFGAGVFAESLAERRIPLPPTGLSPVAYLDSLGVIDAETLLVHVIDVEAADFEILRQRRPRIAHCPKSNAKLAHGIARIDKMRSLGLTLGLGTDSVASNNVVDMFEEMRTAVFQQRSRTTSLESLDASAAFRMATLGGAECLGLSHLFGSLDLGKRADFAVVDLNNLALQPVYDPIATMVYSASRHNVRATYIGGMEVKVDAGPLLEKASSIADRLG